VSPAALDLYLTALDVYPTTRTVVGDGKAIRVALVNKK
jgi:hypothetical protein